MKRLTSTLFLIGTIFSVSLQVHAFTVQYNKAAEPCIPMLKKLIEDDVVLSTKGYTGVSNISRTRDTEGEITSVSFDVIFDSTITGDDLIALEALVDTTVGKRKHRKTARIILRNILRNATQARKLRLMLFFREYPDFVFSLNQNEFTYAHTVMDDAETATDLTTADKNYMIPYVPTGVYQ